MVNSTLHNKKSRIYGTSDLICLSIYLSALLKSASDVQIGLKCTDRPQMYVHLTPIGLYRADPRATVTPLLGKGVQLAVKSANLAQGSDTPSPGRVRSASNVWKSASNVRISLKCTNRPQMYSCLIGSSNVQLSDWFRQIHMTK